MKYSFKIDKETQKILSKQANKIAFLFTLCGILILVCALLSDSTNSEFIVYLTSGIIFLSTGVALFVLIKKTSVAVIKKNKVVEYEFLENYMTVSVYSNNEPESNVKVKYRDITKIKNTKDTLILICGLAASYTILKSQIKDEELNMILNLIKKEQSNA